MNADEIYQFLSNKKWFKEKSMDEQGQICLRMTEEKKRMDYETRFLPMLNKEQRRLLFLSINIFGDQYTPPADEDTIKYFNVDFVFECLIEAWKNTIEFKFVRPMIKATVDQLTNCAKCYQAGQTLEDMWIV